MADKQLEYYKIAKPTYTFEMSEDEVIEFQKEFQAFIKEKLGERAYIGFIGFQRKLGDNDQLYQTIETGLDNRASIWNTLNCLKTINQRLQQIGQIISAPLQPITAQNNPLIQPKVSKDPDASEK